MPMTVNVDRLSKKMKAKRRKRISFFLQQFFFFFLTCIGELSSIYAIYYFSTNLHSYCQSLAIAGNLKL